MFDVIKNFLLEHWELVLSSIFLLASFVLGLLKKKPVFDKLSYMLSYLYKQIPVFINLVETPGKGYTKKQLVLELCKEFLSQNFGFNDFDTIEDSVSQYIEIVLTTPQKKKED